ncbi:MAG: chaperonin GroEL, partial [Chloroflexota bacterium]|nr:chaperonin GroEL [Chloroflexota bacterium]
MISHKEVLLGASARERIRTGVDLIGDAVRVTMGPRGRNVVLERKYALPAISNDGYTVANSINSLADPFVDTGAKLAYQAAKKTNEDAGDGTSTSAVLTQAMYAAALKLISAGYNPMILRRGMELAGAAVTDHLKGMARDLDGDEELTWVASLSANDPEIGEVVAGVYTKLGADAGVNLEDGSTSELTVEYLAGLTFDRGLKSPYFGSGEDIKAEIDQPYIFITDQKLEAANEIVPFLEKFVSNGLRNLLVIAEDIEKEALAALVINKLRGNLNVAAVKAPAFGDRRRGMLED